MSDHTYELTLMNTNEAGSCSFNLRWEPGTDEECLITMDDRNFRVSFENTVLGNYKLIVSWDAIKKDTSAPQMAQPRLMIEEEEEPSESIRWPYGGPYNLDSLFRASQKAQMREIVLRASQEGDRMNLIRANQEIGARRLQSIAEEQPPQDIVAGSQEAEMRGMVLRASLECDKMNRIRKNEEEEARILRAMAQQKPPQDIIAASQETNGDHCLTQNPRRPRRQE